ncbi:MAG: 2-oxo-4-hydroxy-4-carboxy-5-ureidoimidazoline decarboxylase [Bauldia sp.]
MNDSPIPLDAVNRMDEATFVATFGDVAEHAPWVAAEAAGARPFATREAMIDAFAAVVADAAPDRQRQLLLAHPDLAGKAAIAGELTQDSRREQKGAGLDRLTADEHARFTELNTAYRERHGIPFILAVRGAGKDEIMTSCQERLRNRPQAEFARAIGEVECIIQYRIEERVRQ